MSLGAHLPGGGGSMIYHPMVVPGGRPPAARMLAPATYDASSEQSHTITCAISSGVPCRCGGHHSSLLISSADVEDIFRKEVRR